MEYIRAAHGSWPDRRIRRSSKSHGSGRIGSGWEVFEISLVGSGRVRRSSKPHEPGRFGLGWVTRPDLTQPASFGLAREQPWKRLSRRFVPSDRKIIYLLYLR